MMLLLKEEHKQIAMVDVMANCNQTADTLPYMKHVSSSDPAE